MKKKIAKKLQLKKTVIANLNSNQLNKIIGGANPCDSIGCIDTLTIPIALK
jgi:natural product precursor